MKDNPYLASQCPTDSANSPLRSSAWPGSVLWAALGFLIGTVISADFVLSVSLADRLYVGALTGGVPLALAGAWYGARRTRKYSERTRAVMVPPS